MTDAASAAAGQALYHERAFGAPGGRLNGLQPVPNGANEMMVMPSISAHITPDKADKVRGRRPMEDAPERGMAGMFDIELSTAEYWIEGEHHVIRSLEFDVIAGGSTFEAALTTFLAEIMGFAIYLGELESPAANEEEMFHLLAPRVARLAQHIEQLTASKKQSVIGAAITGVRHRRDTGRRWHQLSEQPGSAVPSLA